MLTNIAMEYPRSRMLAAAARLGLADALGDAARSVEELAVVCEVNPESLYRLLRGLASFGVVSETAPHHFVLTPFGRPLRKDAHNSEWAAIVFWADLLADSWSYLTECVRSGESAAQIMQRQGIVSRWAKDPNAKGIFGAVMGTAPAEDYMPLAQAWDFTNCQTVADLGGGGGALIAAVLTAYPHLRGMLVDRPEFIQPAASRLESEGLLSRCQTLSADLIESAPAGADVYLLKNVLHGYDDAAALRILQNCRVIMPPHGRVLVIEYLLPDIVDHADPQLERRLTSDLNMLAVTGGKERSLFELKALLKSAGLDCQRVIEVPGQMFSIIEAALP